MAGRLSTLLNQRVRTPVVNESNLDVGQISVYYPSRATSTFRCQVCWKSPGDGTAVIEIWGAGGSGGKMCCCGLGVAANPGAYSKKTIAVTANSYVCGTIGMSSVSDNLCNKGQSEGTCFSICLGTAGTCSCMCAQGGQSGWTHCAEGGSMSCCIMANYGFTGVYQPGGAGCWIVRNDSGNAAAFGGDINRSGGQSCTFFGHCNPCCACRMIDYVKTSPGTFSTCGAVLSFQRETETGYSMGPGNGLMQELSALNSAGRNPIRGGYWAGCWTSARGCNCYEDSQCTSHLPYGIPAISGSPCPGVRDHGWRGGNGALRVTFIGS